MKILCLGAYGLLGTELRKINPNIIAAAHIECEIEFLQQVISTIGATKPDIVINCAAVMDNRAIEQDPLEAIQTNIIGAANIAQVCAQQNIRLVYISTDYIFKGDQGNYKESDPVLPFNAYAWSKLGGEASSRLVKNHLIIRTSFGRSEFAYKEAFTDKWASKDYVDVIAPMILEAALSPLTGVLNIGTERKTLHAHASQRNQVKPVRLAESNFSTPYDTSLNLQKWMDYKSEKPIAKPHTNCRACGHHKLTKYLDLGLMPLANNLETTSLRARNIERYPLQVMFCEECGLSQLSVVIDPVKLYGYYTYMSGISQGYVKHCRQMAKDLKVKFGLDKSSFHIDIAGNDGTLLKEFKSEIGGQVLNIDPAENLAAIAHQNGIPTKAAFWSQELADTFKWTADLITATNVFAHVADMFGFLKAAKTALKKDGVLVIECPYLIDFMENNEYDTIYHEHLSYVSIGPVNKLCEKIGMFIVSVEKQGIHGGTVRIIIANEGSNIGRDGSKHLFIANEQAGSYHVVNKYHEWGEEVRKQIATFGKEIYELKRAGHSIAAIGASAKGNTLLNACGINTDLVDFICDDTPTKIGRYSPGTGIPIVNMQELGKKKPDYLIILAWNFKEALMKRALENGFEGAFITPIPHFTISYQIPRV